MNRKRKLIERILSGEKKSLRIEGYTYDIDLNWEGEGIVALIPRGLSGSVALSSISYESYAFTHGGPVFRKAVKFAKELDEALKGRLGSEV